MLNIIKSRSKYSISMGAPRAVSKELYPHLYEGVESAIAVSSIGPGSVANPKATKVGGI